jgi:hexosaminidase
MDKNADYNNASDMAQYFVHRFSNILAERNLIAAGWEEIALLHGDEVKPNPAFVGKNLQPFVWNNMWNSGAEDIGYQLANAGYPVVLAHVTNFYFDLAYHKDPNEPGYYWGNFIDTKRPWEYTPFDITKCAEEDRFGNAIDRKHLQKNIDKLTTKGAQNVLGIQGLLWSENNLGAERMEHFFFPKMLGLAERAWAQQPDWAKLESDTKRNALKAKAWNQFANTIGQYDLPRLDFMNGGYNYRIATPGIKVIDNNIHINQRYPGLTIKYTTDGSEPSMQSESYTSPLPYSENIKVKTYSKNGRACRTIDTK